MLKLHLFVLRREESSKAIGHKTKDVKGVIECSHSYRTRARIFPLNASVSFLKIRDSKN